MTPLQFYFHMRTIGISPRLSAVATLVRFSAGNDDLQMRLGRIAHWRKQREARVATMAKSQTAVQAHKTAQLAALADYCRDNGFGAARRDKLGIRAG